MADVNLVVKKVLEVNLPSSGVDGEIYLTNKQNCYIVNKNGALIKNTDVIVTGILPTENIIPNKLYILTTNYSLHIYDGTTWHDSSNNSSSLLIKQDGTNIETNVSEINFTGDGITVTKTTTGKIQINVEGGVNNFPNVKNLGMTINTDATVATISFNNPTVDTISKIYIYYSYSEDLSNKLYSYVSTNATLLKDDFTITTGTNNTCTLTIDNNNRNKTIYVRCFVDYGSLNYSSGSSIQQVLKDIIPNDPITSFSALQQSDKIVLSWINPSGTNNSDFGKVIIIENEAQSPTSINDGIKVYEGNTTTTTLINKDKSKHYYYRAFIFDTSNNVQDNINEVCDIQMDSTPPSNMVSFTSIVYNGSIKIKMQDPTDSDWKGTMIRRSTVDYPKNINDGNLVIDYQTKDLYKNGYIDSGLQNAILYFYSCFPYDNNLNCNTSLATNNKLSATPLASAVPEGLNLKLTNLNQGVDIKIDWQNSFAPNGVVWQGRILFVSTTEDLDGKDFIYCSTNATDLTISGLTGTGQGVIDTYTQTGVTLGTTYYYRLFMKYDVGYSAGASVSVLAKDTDALSNITGLVTNVGDSQNTIQWYNPNTATDTDFAKIQIFKKQGIVYPDGTNDLEKVYESTNKNDGVLNTFVDTGLTNSIMYSYLIKLLDINGNVNTNTKFQLTPLALPIYSIIYNKTTKTFTRGGLATGLTATDLLTISPWKDIKRCLVDDSVTVLNYLKSTDSNYKQDGTSATLDGTQGQVMSEYPLFYYGITKDGDNLILSIANSQVGTLITHPMFIHGSTTYNKAYIGVFEGYKNVTTNKMESKIGVLPITNLDANALRICAVARGSNWSTMDYNALSAIDILYAIAYASFNPQSTMLGITSDTTIHQTGETLTLGNLTGNANSTSDGKHACSIFGLENLYGNTHKFIDGLITSTTKLYHANTGYSTFVSEASIGNYSLIDGYTPQTTNGFIDDIQYLSGFKNAFIPNSFLGDDTNGYSDYFYSLDGVSGYGLSYLYGKYDGGTTTGLFSLAFINTTNNSKTKNFDTGAALTSGIEYTVSFDKSIDMLMGAKELTSVTLDDSGSPIKLNLNYSLSNVSGRLMAWK